MPPVVVSLQEALQMRERGALFIDARSPSEFASGTIPGAINLPVFDDGERALVGTTYKQQSRRMATTLGIEIVSPKIPRLLESFLDEGWTRGRQVVVFCWRGGMRSRSLATFLELAGVRAVQLQGGHKAFRTHVVEFMERGRWGRLLVLRGMTGVGKTRLLWRLREQGYPVIDLEGLAHHRGSAFGALGLEPQPSQRDFEARLWDALRNVPPDAYALAEGESRHIGRLALPKRVYESLQVETSLWINASLDYRVEITLADYPACEKDKTSFEAPIRALKPRLGAERVASLLTLLEQDRWQELVRDLMVYYYDPLYRHTFPDRRIEIDMEPEEQGIERLKHAIAQVLAEAPGGGHEDEDAL